jgi:hypothetical protein
MRFRRTSREASESNPDITYVRGLIAAGPFAFSGPPARHTWLRRYNFEDVRAVGAEFQLDEVHLTVMDSEFQGCVFRQQAKILGEPPPQGNIGWRNVIYRDCTFERVRFRLGPGFYVDSARFERCVFRHCRFNSHFSFRADYVDCVFEGRIATAVFYGRDATADFDSQKYEPKTNEFRGNDFSKATLNSVAFRKGIDVSGQKWPTGYMPVVDMP